MAQIEFGTEPRPPWPTAPPTTAHVDAKGDIEIQYPDTTRRLHRIWARDACPCPQCRIEQTAEHRYFLGRVEEAPWVKAATVDGGDVVIDWTDGHTSRYPPSWLEEVVGQARRRRLPCQNWTDADQLADFAFDEVVADHATELALCDAFERQGAVLISGLGTAGGESAEFLAALGAPLRELPFARIHDVFVDPQGYNVAHTSEQVPPHNDFPSYAWPPSGQGLHMLINDATGGMSILVDGFLILDQLAAADPAGFEVLARVPVGFRQYSSDVETWSRQPLVRLDWTGQAVGLRFSNQLMQPADPEDPDLDAFYDAYQRLGQAVCDPANQAQFRLEAGQMILVHGHRVLHARTAYDVGSGPRHLQDVYFEADDIFGRGAMLRGDRPEGPIRP